MIGKGRHVKGQERVRLTQQLVAWYGQGASIRQISDRTGRSYQTIRNMLTDAGVVLRPRGGHRPPPPDDPQTPTHPDTTYARALGAELRRLRRGKGWTRSRMCRDLTISVQTLATYENGTRSLAATRLAELCTLLGTQPHAVLITVDQILPVPGTVAVDLTRLAGASRATLTPARRWAEAQLQNRPHDQPRIALDTAAIRMLAQLCGLTARQLVDVLKRL